MDTDPLEALDPDEKLVLVGLFHWVMNADGAISPEEDDALASLGHRIAGDRFEDMLGETRARFPDVRSLAAAARRIRPEARQMLYDELVSVAASDAYHVDEVRLLDWLADVWGLGGE